MDYNNHILQLKNFWLNILNNNGLIKNNDGSLSVFIGDESETPFLISQESCKIINEIGGTNYVYNIDKQKCYWVDPTLEVEGFKLLLNSFENNSTIIKLNNDSDNKLEISFDYLFKFSSEYLNTINTNTLPNDVINTITNFNTKILEYETNLSDISNEINTLTNNINNTLYVINCLSENKVFGLTEPLGLDRWRQIIGDVNYTKFINGDPNTFTCDDVNTIINENETIILNVGYDNVLLTDTSNVFGDKTNLLIELEKLLNNKLEIEVLLNNVKTELEEYSYDNTCGTLLGNFENLDVDLTLECLDSNGDKIVFYEKPLFNTIGYNNLYEYLLNNQNTSGFIVNNNNNSDILIYNDLNNDLTLPIKSIGGDIVLKDKLINELYVESGLNDILTFKNSLSNNIFASQWVSFQDTIEDDNILNLINGKTVYINIRVNRNCGDLSVMLDNITMNVVSDKIYYKSDLIEKTPGFTLTKIIDNKKSWMDNETTHKYILDNLVNNDFEKVTNYNVSDDRLVINSKEIDLNINNYKPYLVYCFDYAKNNTIFLSGNTNTNCEDKICGFNSVNFEELISLDNITSVEQFQDEITKKLINAINRKTISNYSTIKALYDKFIYLSNTKLNNDDILKFINKINKNWVKLIENVIPSTTIWGGTKIFGNDVFNQEKFVYKQYSTIINNNEIISNDINASKTIDIDVVKLNSNGIIDNSKNKLNNITVKQFNFGSEFIGSVTSQKYNKISFISEKDTI